MAAIPRLILAALAVSLCVAAKTQAAGFRFIDVAADAAGPALHGAMWYPCAQPAGQIDLGGMTLPGVKDCPIEGDKLPLVVVSHGHAGSFIGHHDTAETLADAGFVVAAINHPGDTARDTSRAAELSVFIERPTDIKRLIDYMLGASAAAAKIDAARIGFFGFSRGGYTGLILVGANPDWAYATERCDGSSLRVCVDIRNKEYPSQPLTHDPRIKAAVIADPLNVVFTPGSFADVTVPVQLWASEQGGDGVDPHRVAAVDKALPHTHEYHVVPNAAHFAFLTPCAPGLAKAHPELCTDPPGFDRIAFHKQLDADILAFFRTKLPDER